MRDDFGSSAVEVETGQGVIQALEGRYRAAWESSVVMSLAFRTFGRERGLSSDNLKDGSVNDKSKASIHVRILDCPEYQQIVRHYARVRLYVESRSVGAGFLGSGAFLVNRARVADLDDFLRQARERLGGLLDELGSAYESAKWADERTLGAAFDAANYPPFSAVRERFSIRYRFIAVGPAGADSISMDLARAQAASFLDDFRATVDESREALRTEFAGLVSYFAGRLADDGSGKAKRFSENFGKLESLREFCTLLADRDISGDGDLRALADTMRRMVAGVTADRLRDSVSLRAELAESIATIKREADTLIVQSTGRRRFVRGDE